MFDTYIYILLFIFLLLNLYVSYLLWKKDSGAGIQELKTQLEVIKNSVYTLENSIRNDFSRNREEIIKYSKESREELNNLFKNLGDSLSRNLNDVAQVQKNQLDAFSTQLTLFNKSYEEKFSQNIREFNEIQRQKFDSFFNFLSDNSKSTELRLDKMRDTIDNKLKSIQDENLKKLEEMRVTVDEKLQSTLEKRLGESFKLVSERLEAVHKGLGDMQTLATGVGDLKKVLSNVKTRGVLGEYQLANILEQIMTPDQYATNVKTKDGSNENVEFAIKLPWGENRDKVLWLPIDSKFPKEDFEKLYEAYEQVNIEQIELYKTSFVKGIKKCAIEIRDKYIDPPNTTDFAILFLPFESLYAEVLRIPGLFESIQREYKITISGPTTLSAILNSLQMGFRTLAIQKRSSEVWELLVTVKTEFKLFGDVLSKTQKKLQEASNVIEQAGIRSRAIEKKLRNVQELPKAEGIKILEENITEEEFHDNKISSELNQLPLYKSEEE